MHLRDLFNIRKKCKKYYRRKKREKSDEGIRVLVLRVLVLVVLLVVVVLVVVYVIVCVIG